MPARKPFLGDVRVRGRPHGIFSGVRGGGGLGTGLGAPTPAPAAPAATAAPIEFRVPSLAPALEPASGATALSSQTVWLLSDKKDVCVVGVEAPSEIPAPSLPDASAPTPGATLLRNSNCRAGSCSLVSNGVRVQWQKGCLHLRQVLHHLETKTAELTPALASQTVYVFGGQKDVCRVGPDVL